MNLAVKLRRDQRARMLRDLRERLRGGSRP
jgi:hypothetical protein